MDNLTHSLVGLTAAKLGLERLSPAATPLCVLAANAPDSDIVVLLSGDRWTFLEHHRGFTHSIIGCLLLAVLLPVLFYGVDRLIAKLRGRPPQVKFWGLLIASLIVTATHPLLDWTNNYGIRFLLPWNQRWFYGDFVYIIDPFLWLILGGGVFLLTSRTKLQKLLWALLAAVLTLLVVAGPRAGQLPHPTLIAVIWMVAIVVVIVLFTIGVRERWGARIALVSASLAIAYWGALLFAHSRALVEGSDQAHELVKSSGESVARLVVMPTLANPLAWDCVFETEAATYRFELNLRSSGPSSKVVRFPKPNDGLAELLRKVSGDRRAEVFLGFARFPVAQLADPGCTSQTLVQLADLRYTEPGRSRGSFSLELPVDCQNQQLLGRK